MDKWTLKGWKKKNLFKKFRNFIALNLDFVDSKIVLTANKNFFND